MRVAGMKKFSDEYIVITGGSGFIGSCLLRYLNDLAYTKIIIVDDLGTDEKWKNLVGKRFDDVLHPDMLFNWLEGRESEVGAFVHLGACSSTVEKDASFLLENNYRYSKSLAEWALKHQKRFVYASSAATYGDGSRGFDDDHEQLENLQPLNMYGYSKHLFDLWLKNQGLLNDVVGMKYFNVFGPNEYHKGRMCSAVVNMLPQIQKQGSIKLFRSSHPEEFGDGEQKRDFVYAKDVAKMTYHFLIGDMGGIYNVGNGEANTWNALANAVFKSIDMKPQIDYISMPEDLLGKYQNYTKACMKKTVNALGDASKTMPLDKSVADYIQHYLIKECTW
jgi:ADP-L-glycero-D-manno-heptose 6-epimerase